MSIKMTKETNDYRQEMIAAMKSGKDEDYAKAFEAMNKAIAEKVKADFMELQDTNDAAVLAQRGYRQLTAKENKWYQKFIEAAKSNNPKQAFTAIIGSDNEEDLMPTTIIQDVYKDLREEYPLLNAINFQHVGFTTKWILNDHATQLAVWGQITDEITKEINSAFRVIDIDQNKLSAYAMIELGMLDLGPTFLDGYIRACLKEAMMGALEVAIVAGTGVNQPIGLIKDIHEGVSYSSTDGFPNKAAVAVTDFTPASYGALVAQMAVTERGKKRRFGKVGMIVNQTDYLTKVMPATTVMNANGAYVNNLFPFPTNVYVSNAVDDGKAVLFLENEYFMGAGGSRNGVIEYSDEYKWLEDVRTFKVKQYAAGRATDNTCALYLDISKLEPAYITVKNHEVVTA
jgi:HK97 family phage major capsid protein